MYARRLHFGAFVFVLNVFLVSSAMADTTIANLLDADRDGIYDPYEVLDKLLLARNEIPGELTEAALIAFALRQKGESEAEVQNMVSSLDLDGDGFLAPGELGEGGAEIVGELDHDGDGLLGLSEAMAINSEGQLLLNREEVQARVSEIFSTLDSDKDELIDLLKEVGEERRGRVSGWDSNRDGQVSRQEAQMFIQADNIPVVFEVEGQVAHMTGVITSRLPAKVLRLLFEHPEVTTIEMNIVPGSIDDVANLRAATYVHQHGLTTRLSARSSIASGGTDFFVGGKTRIIEKGAAIGVHSWSPGPGLDGSDIPRDDPQHQMYVEFYESVGVPGEFYWYTMEAAPPEQMHLMTEEEISLYSLRTGNVH